MDVLEQLLLVYRTFAGEQFAQSALTPLEVVGGLGRALFGDTGIKRLFDARTAGDTVSELTCRSKRAAWVIFRWVWRCPFVTIDAEPMPR